MERSLLRRRPTPSVSTPSLCTRLAAPLCLLLLALAASQSISLFYSDRALPLTLLQTAAEAVELPSPDVAEPREETPAAEESATSQQLPEASILSPIPQTPSGSQERLVSADSESTDDGAPTAESVGTEEGRPEAYEGEVNVDAGNKSASERSEGTGKRAKKAATKARIRAKFAPAEGQGVPFVEASRTAAEWTCRSKTHFVFVFVNRKSGGQAGSRWLAGANKNGEYTQTFKDICTRVLIYDLLADHEGFQLLREVAEIKRTLAASPKPTKKYSVVRVIAVGGDGTVMWVNREAVTAKVPMAWVAFGIVGFGTGNDFAQSYGWAHGNAQRLNIFKGDTLKALVQMWQKAAVARHDLWKTTVSTFDNGYFEKVSFERRTLETLMDDATGLPIRTFESPFILYLGIGFDALVGIEFDRLRSTSRLRNRIMYGVAFLKLFGSSWKNVTEQIETVYALDGGQKKVLFTTNAAKYPDAMRLEQSISLTFLNNRSMIGGIPLWRHTARVGVLPPANEKPGDRNVYETFKRRLAKAHQSMGDTKIELISFHRRFDLLRSILIDYDAAGRLSQHRGPFLVSFYPQEQAGPVAFQTDGEFRIGHGVKTIYVEFVDTFNVLKNVSGSVVKG
ncbi:putative diacylglycerol kinase [Neospora caninum Liverpool]|uniref:Diacylglycerol kinase n=1 Tax=Neospora caninum (strain Liverpool) TaxID=572307 RepID=F0VGS4_NEOCL|nr:putative diacylglycerol kinase [Neospora caninum Liverpool]CBZ52918.1 putative diacylglycerol kinase [Neospora caninum Liverpool]CEL66900.1 TPA: diacylglycerol kinase, putative [Neospora caninum Liverpool]|eukprot:XP_003882950.1 putative diacylglycerol kinase [Neospora caninum Liverpool]